MKLKIEQLVLVMSLLLVVNTAAIAQDIGTPDPEALKSLYPGKTYSPYAQRSFPGNVYWGETHLHTGLSLDAGLFGTTLGHEDAYRFARGEEIEASSGLPVKLSRPLDWLVITDHSDMMGIATDIHSEGASNPQGMGNSEDIFLITDGLPTQGATPPRAKTINGRERQKLYRQAVKLLPRNVPVNIILAPLEGDPMAASEFWQLAQVSRGSFMSPSEDWP